MSGRYKSEPLNEFDEKKRKRLERNRESARECRKRKKEKKQSLKAQLAALEADNLQLRLQLQVGHETNERLNKSAHITSQLDSMIKEGANEADIHRTIKEMQERFSDYGRDRRSAIDFHLSQLRRCLQPTQTTRAILWLMSVIPTYHDPVNNEIVKKDDSEIANILFSMLSETKPTPFQRKQMISFTVPSAENRDPFVEIKKSTENCNTMLQRIEEIIGNKNESLDNEMSNIQAILSARQTAKFILWIDQNPHCMQMLEALWPHINTQSADVARSESLEDCDDNDNENDSDGGDDDSSDSEDTN